MGETPMNSVMTANIVINDTTPPNNKELHLSSTFAY